jgi:predicted component of type VI protein secretion system
VICPNKICKQEIPDDSLFCDQCGSQLLRCTKCGNIGTSKFCAKCGGAMIARERPPAAAPPVRPAAPPVAPAMPVVAPPVSPAVSATPAAAPPAASAMSAASPPVGATVLVRPPVEKIFLCHPEGWKLELENNDILGRSAGRHAGQLGKFPVISSNHAKITRGNNEWFITDLKSTNKTFVNGAKLEPNTPVKIKQDDVVILANVTFTVREA